MTEVLKKIWKWFGGFMSIYAGIMAIYLIYRFATGLITGDHPNITAFYVFYPVLIINTLVGIRVFYGVFRNEKGYNIFRGDKNE